MVVHTCDPSTKRQKQEDPKCEPRLSYTERLSLAPPTRRKSFCLFAFESQQSDYDRFVYGSQQRDYDRFV